MKKKTKMTTSLCFQSKKIIDGNTDKEILKAFVKLKNRNIYENITKYHLFLHTELRAYWHGESS